MEDFQHSNHNHTVEKQPFDQNNFVAIYKMEEELEISLYNSFWPHIKKNLIEKGSTLFILTENMKVAGDIYSILKRYDLDSQIVFEFNNNILMDFDSPRQYNIIILSPKVLDYCYANSLGDFPVSFSILFFDSGELFMNYSFQVIESIFINFSLLKDFYVFTKRLSIFFDSIPRRVIANPTIFDCRSVKLKAFVSIRNFILKYEDKCALLLSMLRDFSNILVCTGNDDICKELFIVFSKLRHIKHKVFCVLSKDTQEQRSIICDDKSESPRIVFMSSVCTRADINVDHDVLIIFNYSSYYESYDSIIKMSQNGKKVGLIINLIHENEIDFFYRNKENYSQLFEYDQEIMVYSKDLFREQQILQEISGFDEHNKILSTVLMNLESGTEIFRKNYVLPSFLHKKPCLGHIDFRSVVEFSYYIDKTRFISNILELDINRCLVFTRPRRFGKSINLSMIRYFYEIHPNKPNIYRLFKGLDISRDPVSLEHQGKYPVLYINFSGFVTKCEDFEKFKKVFSRTISELFQDHKYVLQVLNDQEKKEYLRYMKDNVIYHSMGHIIPFLCDAICKYHHQFCFQKKPIILIDEYDAPFNKILGEGFEENAVSYIKDFYESITKKATISQCIIVGIFEVPVQSILSNSNNFRHVGKYSNNGFQDFFGYTEIEIDCLLKDFNLSTYKTEIKKYYNGYKFGRYKRFKPCFIDIYNPYSVNSFIIEEEIEPFWINSGDLLFLEYYIERNFTYDICIMNQLFEDLNSTLSIPTYSLRNLDKKDKFDYNLFSLLYHCGYLTIKVNDNQKDNNVDLVLVNEEIRSIFPAIYRSIFSFDYQVFSNELTRILEGGNMELFIKYLKDFMMSSFTYHLKKGLNETSLLLITLFKFCHKSFECKQSVNSGKGTLDVSLIPFKPNHPLYIFELKYNYDKEEHVERMQKLSNNAYEQIIEKQYFNTYGSYIERLKINNVFLVGLAFWYNNVHCTYSLHGSEEKQELYYP